MQKILISTLLIAVDQYLKYCARNGLLFSLGGFFNGTVCNPHISWGIPLDGFLFVSFWSFFMLILFIFLKKNSWDIFLLAVFSGALSNMLDRLAFGCVTDFISVGSFPVFNFADILITGGTMLFLTRIHLKNNH